MREDREKKNNVKKIFFNEKKNFFTLLLALLNTCSAYRQAGCVFHSPAAAASFSSS